MRAPLPNTADAQLVELALAGRQDACSALMARHREAVWRLARAHVGDPDEALDIVQEAFVAAFSALSRYDAARPFRAWIARITLNKCRDWARRRAVRRLFVFARPLEDAAHVADPGATPEETAGSRAALVRIEAAVAALPVALKDVLLLRTIEGLDETDTAQALGISRKAVETRLHRARAKLRTSLDSDFA